MVKGTVRVGTSGYVYAHWKGRFYPDDLPRKDWFAHYAERFGAVEINNTFYRLPTRDLVARWREAAPPGFTYAFKASRYITHRKKLLPGGSHPDAARDLLDALAGAGPRLGPVLFQLPPQMKRDDARLRAFLARLPQRGDVRYAFEFRHASWYAEDVYDLLGEHGVAFCMHDWPDAPTPRDVVTAGLVYVRFHGVERAYAGLYGPRRLAPWRARIARWRDAGHDVFAFFNNDEAAYATRDAAWLADKLEVAPHAPAQ
ncbi:MAG: hypothetical protein QOE90_684 [Thermoplasmata archaeon]|jgi:uncharacterized protein YecE (DUF72 family)|nr:hypothetical protein [Thermoplasmata archaeon]